MLERLCNINNHLQELDTKHSTNIQSFQENIKFISKIQKNSKLLKVQLFNLEKQVIKEKNSLLNGFTEISSSLVSFSKNQQVLSNNIIQINKENLKKILKKIVPSNLIANFERISNFNSPIKLLDNLNIPCFNEEPELELNSGSENKKIINHMNMLTKTLEKAAVDLLKLLNEGCVENSNKIQTNDIKTFIDLKLNNSISPNDLKALKFKINRLHNRGSLTDDEAKNMLGKISIMPFSPNQNQIERKNLFKKNFDVSSEIICDENPVTETREKQEKLGASFTKELGKKIKVLKSTLKRSSTPIKKITRNTSLPKAISVSKYKSKDKMKITKAKAKSPHSFM